MKWSLCSYALCMVLGLFYFFFHLKKNDFFVFLCLSIVFNFLPDLCACFRCFSIYRLRLEIVRNKTKQKNCSNLICLHIVSHIHQLIHELPMNQCEQKQQKNMKQLKSIAKRKQQQQNNEKVILWCRWIEMYVCIMQFIGSFPFRQNKHMKNAFFK